MDLLTAAQAARILGCDRRTVMRQADRGDIPVHSYIGIRGDRRFERRVIERMAAEGVLLRRPEALLPLRDTNREGEYASRDSA